VGARDPNCRFCQIIAGEESGHVVFEDDRTIAFLDNRPLFPGHSLLVPRAHHETLSDLPSELVGPLFDLWRTVGLFNTWPGLIIPYMSFTLPLAIWTLSAFFREIPWEMEQAAQVDGATSWQAFRKVIVPLAAPGVFTAAILTFFYAWNEFVLAISLTSTTASRTVPAQLSYFVGPDPFNPPFSQLAMASVVVTIPVIIIVLLFQRKIVAGLTSVAVKG
jgi:multiple sugar transport system permease protein